VGKAEYVRAYKVAYSLDGREFTFYKDEKLNTDKVGWDMGLGAGLGSGPRTEPSQQHLLDQNHRIIEWLRLEGTLKAILSDPLLCSGCPPLA